MLCGSLDGRGVCGRMNIRVCIAESLCCLPETIKLLISYTAIQNKVFFKKKVISKMEICTYPWQVRI